MIRPNRALRAMLARHPNAYLRLLRAARRGSIEKRAFLALVRRGDVVLDVGANLGYFTLLFADIAGADGLVHAFEPVPATFLALATSIRTAAPAAHVELVQAACADETGAATITMPGDDAQQASLVSHATGSWATAVEQAVHQIRTIRLDEYLGRHDLDRVDFVKCDAEGAELPILKGMGRALARLQPVLCIEVSAAWTRDFGYTPSDLSTFLTDAGYDCFFTVHDAITPIPPEQVAGFAERHESFNVVCAKHARHDDRITRLTLVA